jgi:hypothetical protein
MVLPFRRKEGRLSHLSSLFLYSTSCSDLHVLPSTSRAVGIEGRCVHVRITNSNTVSSFSGVKLQKRVAGNVPSSVGCNEPTYYQGAVPSKHMDNLNLSSNRKVMLLS